MNSPSDSNSSASGKTKLEDRGRVVICGRIDLVTADLLFLVELSIKLEDRRSSSSVGE